MHVVKLPNSKERIKSYLGFSGLQKQNLYNNLTSNFKRGNKSKILKISISFVGWTLPAMLKQKPVYLKCSFYARKIERIHSGRISKHTIISQLTHCVFNENTNGIEQSNDKV